MTEHGQEGKPAIEAFHGLLCVCLQAVIDLVDRAYLECSNASEGLPLAAIG